jgi:leader peptidase (prepilin peptidase)/N-methyltransferase
VGVVIESGFLEPVLALLFGLIAGSFLNVCIHRWPRGRSVVRPRSHCVRCRKTIAWYDNIPLFSYIALGGKCRSCGRSISLRYPTVELLTGLVFFFFVRSLGPTLLALKMCVFGAMLVALIFTDIEKRLLPDELTLGGTLIGLVFALFVPVPDFTAQAILWLFGIHTEGRLQGLAEAAFGALLPALFLWLGGWIYEKVRHREGLGLGDVKLIVMVGAFLGLRNALLALVIGSLVGSVLGYGFIKVTGKDPATYPLPFGSFLGAAALAAAMAGPGMLGWYSGL